jgi:hypothetical protein
LPLVLLTVINNLSLKKSHNTSIVVIDTLNDLINFPSDVVNKLTTLHINCKGKPLRLNFVLLLILSGDINPNPGPVNKIDADVNINPGPRRGSARVAFKHPCSICYRSVAKTHRAVLCDSCDLWSHIKCTSVSPTILFILHARVVF